MEDWSGIKKTASDKSIDLAQISQGNGHARARVHAGVHAKGMEKEVGEKGLRDCEKRRNTSPSYGVRRA